MLRRSGFTHRCVMQDIAGYPRGQAFDVSWSGAGADVAAVPVLVEAGCHGVETASMSELELSAAGTFSRRRKWREWAPH